MIKVYTDKALGGKKLITFNDAHFEQNINPSYLDETCRKLMKSIDGAEILDEKTWQIETKLGLGNILDLSTGLKTLINIYNLRKTGERGVVDAREVGENLVPTMLKILNGGKISIYIGDLSVMGTRNLDFDFLLNDKYEVKGTKNLRFKLAELRG